MSNGQSPKKNRYRITNISGQRKYPKTFTIENDEKYQNLLSELEGYQNYEFDNLGMTFKDILDTGPQESKRLYNNLNKKDKKSYARLLNNKLYLNEKLLSRQREVEQMEGTTRAGMKIMPGQKYHGDPVMEDTWKEGLKYRERTGEDSHRPSTGEPLEIRRIEDKVMDEFIQQDNKYNIGE
jgi:hypothetical protein